MQLLNKGRIGKVFYTRRTGDTLVLGGLTRNYTRTPCAGDVISLTCTVPGTLLGWDFTDLSRTIQVDVTNIASFQQDQYTWSHQSCSIPPVSPPV